MVRKPKRSKTQKASTGLSKRAIIFYTISILVILSMALGLVLSTLAPSVSAPPPSAIWLPALLNYLL